MGQVIAVTGSIVAGPLGSQDTGFPNGVQNIALRVPSISAPVSFYSQKLVTAAAFAELDGIGTGKAVTKALFLYLATNGPCQLRITYQADSGPDIVSVEPLNGTLLKQLPAGNYIKLVEILGTVTVEYFAAGNE